MIARITRILLFVQLFAAIAIGIGLQHLPAAPGAGIPASLAFGCGILTILCVRALIAANNFRLAARFAGPGLQVALGWRRGLALYLRELAATLVSSSWHMPFHRIGAMSIFPGNAPPILLIHGYGCNSGYWQPLHRRLRAERLSHHAIDLEPVLADIDSYAPQIEAAVTALIDASGQANVIIIGHSMGGLVARAWMRRHGSARVARLITLGTPHHGTALAQFGPGENPRQMRRANAGCSAWLAGLHAAERDAALPLTSIYSHHDNIIAPSHSSFVDGAHNIAFAGIGHVALASAPAIMACLLDQIRHVSDTERQRSAADAASDNQPAISIQEKPSS